jgi:hypothetical protein
MDFTGDPIGAGFFDELYWARALPCATVRHNKTEMADIIDI